MVYYNILIYTIYYYIPYTNIYNIKVSYKIVRIYYYKETYIIY